MPLKKSSLQSSHWKGCDELRGGMGASLSKHFALPFVQQVNGKNGTQADGLCHPKTDDATSSPAPMNSILRYWPAAA